MHEARQQLEGLVLGWCKGVPEFEPLLATAGAYLALSYLGGQEEFEDVERLLPLALNISFWTWLDDRSDKHLHVPVVMWEELLAAARRGEQPSSRRTPEVDFLLGVSHLLQQQAQTREDHQWWQLTAESVLRAFLREEQISRRGLRLSYAEYLVLGAQSITVDNMVACASLVGGLGLARRRSEPSLEQGIKYLCTVARLENDLFSHEKDRREGVLANAALLMEQFMTLEQAVKFVAAERRAYEELLEGVLAHLGTQHPFPQLARNMLSGNAHFYELCRARYAGSM